ncbi:MAG TPA: hypothetical protein VEB63_03015 [Chitinophagaceae bacterium]|nr:hypothetical protein [Chitinophagaceae bacterium]
MQFKETLVRLTLLLLPLFSFSQTTYLLQGDKAGITLNRFEIKTRTDSILNFSKTRPLSRRTAVYAADLFAQKPDLSGVDRYNLNSLYLQNLEYLSPERRQSFRSKKPILRNFYTTPANLYEVHVKDFDLVVNPMIQFALAKENNNSQRLFLNSRGLYVRGKIANKIGYFASLTDNQERDPRYVQEWVDRRKAVPGAGFYKPFKTTGYDYFDARGYFSFNVTRYIDVVFGYDRNFIGNGHRSMFLGDEGSSNLFLKLNTRIWKINYQNLFMELHAAHIPGGDQLVPKKYAAVHHLDVAVTKWLNIGLFEGVVFGRKDRFDFGYLNPVIFYRSIEQQNGSFDNSVAGLDVKAQPWKGIQLYGQLLLDEFLLSEIRRNRGWWANKWGIQLGGKYVDAFGLRNLDLQVEHNRVRPFTYSHRDSVANYTHYNQPMAHPLGANFSETVGIIRYQPAPRWNVVGKLIYYTQGRDSSAVSNGSNIFLPNTPPYRVNDYGFDIGSGWKTAVVYGSFLLSYELRENMFLDLHAISRREETKTVPLQSMNTSVISFGFRWNMQRREVDY